MACASSGSGLFGVVVRWAELATENKTARTPHFKHFHNTRLYIIGFLQFAKALLEGCRAWYQSPNKSGIFELTHYQGLGSAIRRGLDTRLRGRCRKRS